MTTKERDDKILAYILDNIDGEAYGKTLTTDKERFAFAHACFVKEYGHEIARHGEVKAFAGWLAGLPTVLTVAFYNDEIVELAKSWGADISTECKRDNIILGHFEFMASKFLKFSRRFAKRKE